jgi:hypothetical protein
MVRTPVSFILESEGNPNSWNWNLGDGTRSTQRFPTHIYQKAGLKPFFVVISNGECADTVKSKIFVKENCDSLGLKAAFTFTPDTLDLETAGTVQFTDQSSKASHWNWDFGNGKTSEERNPKIAFSDTGLYTIRLRVQHLNCKDSLIKTLRVKHSRPAAIFEPKPLKLNAYLYPNPVRGGFYLNVSFPIFSPLAIKILNPIGQVVYEKKLNGLNNNQYFNIPLLEEGIYYLTLVGANLCYSTPFIYIKP